MITTGTFEIEPKRDEPEGFGVVSPQIGLLAVGPRAIPSRPVPTGPRKCRRGRETDRPCSVRVTLARAYGARSGRRPTCRQDTRNGCARQGQAFAQPVDSEENVTFMLVVVCEGEHRALDFRFPVIQKTA